MSAAGFVSVALLEDDAFAVRQAHSTAWGKDYQEMISVVLEVPAYHASPNGVNVQITIKNGPAGRSEDARFDVFAEDLDLLVSALATAVQQAKRGGTLERCPNE